MCGIWGIISRTKNGLNASEDMPILKQMMLDTAQRGENSSGLFMTDYHIPTDAPTGVKVLGGPHNIIYNQPLWKEIDDYVHRKAGCIIGHGRHATRGKISAKNAHPFQHEHVTLVHNGTIYGGVDYHKQGETDVDVDSHALAVSIAKHGVLQALARVKGAYAVVVHDANEGCLYIARNDDRPLHVYSNATRHYIMSEGQYLNLILGRYGKLKKDEVVMNFRPETLIKIDLSDPENYTVAGDIKALREEIEAVERAKREKEAEENRKKYQHSGVGGNDRWQRPRNDKERLTPVRDLKITTFKVTRGEKYGTNWRYWGETTTKELVWFITECEKGYEEWVGRAKIHSLSAKQGVCSIFVRHKDISWILGDVPDAPVQLTEEAPANAGTFQLLNGKRVPCDVWQARIVHEGCNTCDRNFTMLSYRDAVLTDDDLLLCRNCAAEFHLVPKGATQS